MDTLGINRFAAIFNKEDNFLSMSMGVDNLRV